MSRVLKRTRGFISSIESSLHFIERAGCIGGVCLRSCESTMVTKKTVQALLDRRSSQM